MVGRRYVILYFYAFFRLLLFTRIGVAELWVVPEMVVRLASVFRGIVSFLF